ncbi:hypothetical protein LLS1_24080 [Leifsonia sp. LS1]|uniref:hypothetical protein n=1 Tax=Leifsonia sp. LS1 TaxID=2828483 RepID=UPI001CFE869E|nr:hypothetical protein [Leifsonia sp. LS1]GIT80739.1 hypothetical protein LLS1_24080 [Leifsonia sp. LS1]
MGFLDRLLGREEPRSLPPQAPVAQTASDTVPQAARSEDEIAVERYRYLLRTAPPETIEQVHEEAFTKLTSEQRRLLFQQLSENAPAGEQPRGDDPRSLAQAATRSELRQPGTLERSLGGRAGGGMGLGGMFATSLLGSVAGYVIGSALVSAFLPSPLDSQAGADGSGAEPSGADPSGDGGPGSTETAGAETSSADAGGDAGGWGDGGGWGDSGGGWGDFGGGDFGGGDFGGGDFI